MASVESNDLFPVRTINFLGRDVPTLGQNEFGPCALLGVVAYAVYNGTVFATHRRYPLWLAAVDTAWGGTLCGLVGWYSDKLGLTP